MPITHSFTSAIADDPTAAAAGEVLPSHWNDEHTLNLTTDEVAASTDKNYVTDAQLVVIGNTSGANSGDQDLSGYQTTANLSSDISADTGSTTKYPSVSAVEAAIAGGGGSVDLSSPGPIGGTTPDTVAATTVTVAKAVADTSTDGLVLETTTAATAGAQKRSPRTRWTASGWKTNSTAAAQTVEFIAEVQPVQGAAAPSGNLVFSSQINGGGYSANTVSLPSAGGLQVNISSRGANGWDADGRAVFINGGAIRYGYNFGSRFEFTASLALPISSAFSPSGVLAWGSSSPDNGDSSLSRISAGLLGLGTGAAGSFAGSLKLTNLLAGGGNGSYVQTPSMTVANLATAATAGAGARAFVTDATATTFLSAVAGGGANAVPVVSDGTNWLIG